MDTVPTAQRLFAIVGDSISVGVGGYVSPLTGPLGSSPGGSIGYVAGYLGNSGLANFQHYGRSGYAAKSAAADFKLRTAFVAASGVTDVVDELGVNDMFASNESAAQLIGYQQTLLANLQSGAPNVTSYWVGTVTPEVNVIAPTPTSECNFTGSISGTVLTVTTAATSCIAVNNTIWNSAITVPTTITSFGTGSGGTGTYNVDMSQNVTSGSIISTNQNNISGVPGNGKDGRRQSYNNVVRSLGITGQTGYYEAALAVENTDLPYSYYWIANGSNDGTHPIQAGGTAIVNYMVGKNALALKQ